jgi:hypothetical protein
MLKITAALAKGWTNQLGWDVPYPSGKAEIFEEIDKNYLPRLEKLFLSER